MSDLLLTTPPSPAQRVRFHPSFGQRFLLTVDTEEEFDWDKPLERASYSIDTIARLRHFQQFCENQGVVPVYLIDYPVATSPLAGDLLREAVAEGRAEVGVQLHPWVNPPFHENVNQYNSYAGNLPIELERAKLQQLHAAITRNFGAAPLIYRAGRYGVGPNTAGLLREMGMAIDTSVRAKFDYSAGGGPNYRDLPITPWWVGESGSLMELPLTTVFSGGLRRIGGWLYPRLWRVPRLRGALARARLLERIPLTPEGVTIAEALRGVDIAVKQGVPVLVLSFHSPSLWPGHTPYVRSGADLDQLYSWWRLVFAHMARRGVQATSVREIINSVDLA